MFMSLGIHPWSVTKRRNLCSKGGLGNVQVLAALCLSNITPGASGGSGDVGMTQVMTK